MIKALIIIGLFFLFSTPIHAHILKSDGSVGAVIHVSPDDDPIVGKESSIYFEFKDKENRFRPQDCSCIFVVEKNSEEIFRQSLFEDNVTPNLDNASIRYTFPERNVYTLRIIGEPKTVGQFQPFTLSYDLRVERETSNTGSKEKFSIYKPHAIHGIIFGIGLLVFVFFIIRNKRKK